MNGLKFIKFSKSKNLNVSFYYNIVAPFFKDSLVIETWGRSLEGPNCISWYSVEANLFI